MIELIERDREPATAARAVRDVRAGGRRVLGLLGETGIGKIALLAAIAVSAPEAGLTVLDGRGVEHERDVPFGVAADGFDAGALAAAGSPLERFQHHRALRPSARRRGGFARR